MATALDGLAAAIAAVADRAAGGVVRVGSGRHAGSGVVVAPGRVLTSARSADRGRILVAFATLGSRIGTAMELPDEARLAVISVDTSGATPLEWASGSDRLVMGQPIFAVTPAGEGTRTTFGSVASRSRPFQSSGGRRVGGLIEHTAALPAGSAGSALLDANGRLVGINVDRLGGGLYLALPTDGWLRMRVS